MSLDFETTYKYQRVVDNVTIKPKFLVKASEVEVWVGYENGDLATLSSLNLEHTLEQPYYFDNQTVNLIPLVSGSFGNVTLTAATKYYQTIYFVGKNGSNQGFIIGVDAHNKTLVANITLTHLDAYTISDVIAANGALWIASTKSDGALQNILHKYDITAGTWTEFSIPGRHQTTRRVIVDGLDGTIWITCKNNHSIVGFNTNTSAFTALYKISRHPTNLAANQNKEVFAICETSIIKWDQSTNTPSTFCANLGHTTLIDDLRTGFMWFVGGGQGTYRVVKSTTGAISAGVSGSQNTSAEQQVALLTNQVTYDKYDPTTDTVASLTVRPHLFIMTANDITVYRATALKGVNSSQILGTGMIALGPQGYYGG